MIVDPSPPLAVLANLGEWQSFSPGLDRVVRVLARLGNPHRSFAHCLIGGTNGKGTVSYNLACNYPGRCGLFISPHVFDARERVTLAGDYFADSFWESAYRRVVEAMGSKPELSYFEWMLVLAVVMFAEAGVDYAVFEIGLGGRLDAANALDPDLCAITNVSMDHMAYLGDSLSEIALEKIAIAREGKPMIVSEGVLALSGVRDRLERIGCRIVSFEAKLGYSGNDLVIDRILKTMDLARVHPQTRALPCRREQIGDVLIDGAHNEDAWRDLADWLRALGTKPNLLCGLSHGRDTQLFLSILGPVVGSIYIWDTAFPNRVPLSAWPVGNGVVNDQNLAELLGEPLLVCGSLYMAGRFREWLKHRQPD